MNIILSNMNTISNFTKEEEEKIKEDLTLINPKYTSAKRYSKYKRTNIPKYLHFFKYLDKGHIQVPSGYIPTKANIIEDSRKEVYCDYPKTNFNFKLRGDQTDAYNSYLDNPDKGLICLQTGKGKTILGISIAKELRQKTLVILHKTDLLIGWKKDIQDFFNNKQQVGIIQGKKRDIQNITLAMVQTLNNMSDEELKYYSSQFGMVIMDECHHCPSTSYDIINYFSCPYKIGLSATPERKDGLKKVMDFYLGGMCYQSKISRQDNDILPFEVIQRVSKLEYTPKVKLINKNGKTQYVVIDNPDKTCKDITDINYNNRPKVPFTFIEGLVFSKDKTYLEDIDREYTEGHSCLVVCRLKDSCRLIEEELKKLNIKTQILYGDSKEAKDVLLDRANKDRHLVTVATANMVSEGTNCNQWEVLIPVLSVANGKDIEQLIGRVRRLKPNNKLKKARVYEYSFPKVYTLNNHIEHRMARYKKLKAYGLEDNNKFGRGYK